MYAKQSIAQKQPPLTYSKDDAKALPNSVGNSRSKDIHKLRLPSTDLPNLEEKP